MLIRLIKICINYRSVMCTFLFTYNVLSLYPPFINLLYTSPFPVKEVSLVCTLFETCACVYINMGALCQGFCTSVFYAFHAQTTPEPNFQFVYCLFASQTIRNVLIANTQCVFAIGRMYIGARL